MAQTLALQTPTQPTLRAGDTTSLRDRIAPLIVGLDETVPLAGPRDRRLVRAPFTGEVIGAVPICAAEDVELAAKRGTLSPGGLGCDAAGAASRDLSALPRSRPGSPGATARPRADRRGQGATERDRGGLRRRHQRALLRLSRGRLSARSLSPDRVPILDQAWQYRHPVGLWASSRRGTTHSPSPCRTLSLRCLRATLCC